MKSIGISLILIVLICTLTNGQENFIYNQNGLNPKYVVNEVESINKTDLFKRSINWVKKTYKNPDEVIKTTIDNSMIRFEGFIDNFIRVNSLGINYNYGATYLIEIEFKDYKYKFHPLSLEYRVPASQYSSGMTVSIDFDDGSSYYNNKGKLRNSSKTVPSSIEGLFNDLNEDLKGYLINEKENNESDDW